MKIERPETVVADDRQKTVRLFWPELEQSGEFVMYGGVSWPTGEEGNTIDDVHGYAVLLGMDTNTRINYVFEELRFDGVQPIMDPELKTASTGCAAWFSQCWTSYMARTYFHDHPEDLQMKFGVQVYNCELIQPKPWFVRVHKEKDKQWMQSIYEFINQGLLKYRQDFQLYRELQLLEVNLRLTPATKALAAALAGVSRNPWRRRNE